jgi:hypothetical protein
MKLRTTTWLPAAVGLAALVGGSEAMAQCNSGCTPTPPSCCTQPPAPPPPPPPPSACCTPPPAPNYPSGGGNFNLNVNINTNANSNANSNENLIRASGFSSLSSRGYYGGGGGAYFNVDQPYPTVIQGLNVEGAQAAQVVRTPITLSRWMASRVVIRAVCIDDRNVPHPASQVQPGREVADGYEGEIYRCIAGTRLQVTWADYLNEIADFDRGQTLLCAKGESLWYRRRSGHGSAQAAGYTAEQYAQMYSQAYGEMYAGQGGAPGRVTVRTDGGAEITGGHEGGEMICAVQKPERDCNERSLLRRYGAGIKVLTLWREEFYTEYREEVVQTAVAASAGYSLTLDGGVGGRAF